MTLAELLVAGAITSAVAGGVLAVAIPAGQAFAVEQEAADLQQRLRVAVESLARDLRAARAVRPYRIGAIDDDPGAGVFFRPATMTAVLPPEDDGRPRTRTYYLQQRSDVSEIRRYDGGGGDFPLVSDVVALDFEYVADAPLPPARLTDGPWLPDAVDPSRFDADLARVKRVGVSVRVQAAAPFRGAAGPLFMRAGTAVSPARLVPDIHVRFDVALRAIDAAP